MDGQEMPNGPDPASGTAGPSNDISVGEGLIELVFRNGFGVGGIESGGPPSGESRGGESDSRVTYGLILSSWSVEAQMSPTSPRLLTEKSATSERWGWPSLLEGSRC